jgi:hypothetical protein
VSVQLDCTGALKEVATEGTTKVSGMSYTSKKYTRTEKRNKAIKADEMPAKMLTS